VTVVQLLTSLTSENFLSPPLLVLSDKLRMDLVSNFGEIYLLPDKHDCVLRFKGRSLQTETPEEQVSVSYVAHVAVMFPNCCRVFSAISG
jgi:hypothetical protein